MITLAVDCMGGDHGPRVTLAACRRFLDERTDARLLLVGLPEALQGFAHGSIASYSNLPANRPDFETWSHSLRQERDQLLDILRLRTLNQSIGLPWGTWKLEEMETDD